MFRALATASALDWPSPVSIAVETFIFFSSPMALWASGFTVSAIRTPPVSLPSTATSTQVPLPFMAKPWVDTPSRSMRRLLPQRTVLPSTVAFRP